MDGRKMTSLTDIAKIPQRTYSPEAQVIRQSDAGLSWEPLGAMNTKQRVGESTPIMFFNNSASLAYVNFGNDQVTSTGAPATALPLLPNSITVYNSGSNEWVVASAATVFGYAADQEQ